MKYAILLIVLIFAFPQKVESSLILIQNEDKNNTVDEQKRQNDFIIYIVLGYGGAGKGTFSQTLQGLGYVHFSLGDFLRQQMKRKTSIGLMYKKQLSGGGSDIPAKIIDPIIYSKIMKINKSKTIKGIILDGYPKTIEEAKKLEAFLIEQKIPYQLRPLLFEVSQEEARERIINREVCEHCNHIYNKKSYPSKKVGICNKCSHKLKKRMDISEKDINDKFKFYEKIEKIIVDYYDNKFLLKKINTSDSIENNIRKFIKLAE